MPTSEHGDEWVDGVARHFTGKQGARLDPVGIVMHYTAGWTTAGDINTLADSSRQVSAHFVVGRDGVITQIVPTNRVAWHAGPSAYNGFKGLNNHFLGIEICNAGWIKRLTNGNYLDQYGQQISPDGQFIGQKRTTFTPPREWHEEYHPRLATGTYVWEPYYPDQLAALDDLVEELLGTHPEIKHIVSHEEIDTREWKTDPGPMFPMRRYTKLLERRDDPPSDPTSKTGTVVWKELNLRSAPNDTIYVVMPKGTVLTDVTYPTDNRAPGWARGTLMKSDGTQVTGWAWGDGLEVK